jgi:hydrogenase maturation protein HypF
MQVRPKDINTSPIMSKWEHIQARKITVRGMVQGIGFRPWVYRLAQQLHLNGTVSNHSQGVEINLEGSPVAIDIFIHTLQQGPPEGSIIQSISTEEQPVVNQHTFHIDRSTEAGSPALLITPDLAPCRDCLEEITQLHQRRYRYPFTSCTQCGPRYSITHGFPYDREKTTMDVFPLCPDCLQEYRDPSSRRFHAQTNACPTCGPQLTVWEETAYQFRGTEEILTRITKTLQRGEIAAVKSIGGFLLLTDASNAAAVARLRARKKRPAKPLAVLFNNIQQIESHANVSPLATQWLSHRAAPILVLPTRSNSNLAWEEIQGTLNTVGAMLPSSPLLQLIADDFGMPLIATSANISGCPLLYRDEEAAQALVGIADLIVGNNRSILYPQDDSVLRISEGAQQVIWLRRGRGIAPYAPSHAPAGNETVVAMGALLKSSVAWQTTSGYQYLSQYLGNTDVYEAQLGFQALLESWKQLFQTSATQILTDAHLGYFSHQEAQRLHQATGVSVFLIPHHAAHAMAILAERQLIHFTEPIAVFCWDGTGLGEDGSLWGSACFIYASSTLHIQQHWQSFPVLSGDRMATDCRLPLLSLWHTMNLPLEAVWSKFTSTEKNIYKHLLAKANMLRTSSAGRVFDAVACLLGLVTQQAFEGQAAMLLEAKANEAAQQSNDTHVYSIPIESGEWQLKPMFQAILNDMEAGLSASIIALRFHRSLAQTILQAAQNLHCAHMACSGGVFQNGLLVDLLVQHCPPSIRLYFHESIPPNDESIALGQLWYHQTQTTFSSNHQKNETICA